MISDDEDEDEHDLDHRDRDIVAAKYEHRKTLDPSQRGLLPGIVHHSPTLPEFRARGRDNRARIEIMTSEKEMADRIMRDQERRQLGRKRRVKAQRERLERRLEGVLGMSTPASLNVNTPKPISGLADAEQSPDLAFPTAPPAPARPPTTTYAEAPASPLKAQILPISEKGLGLVATQDIPLGGLIISERPFIEMDHPCCPRQVVGKVGQMSGANRRLFESFTADSAASTTNRAEQWTSIAARNGIPLGGDPNFAPSDDIIPLTSEGDIQNSIRCGIFEYICRANHSCVPNSRWSWDGATKTLGKSSSPKSQQMRMLESS